LTILYVLFTFEDMPVDILVKLLKLEPKMEKTKTRKQMRQWRLHKNNSHFCQYLLYKSPIANRNGFNGP